MSLPPEVRSKYVTIVDSILAASDLDLISEKKIRKGIQEAVEYDITPHKAAIKELILERFDVFNAKKVGVAESVEPANSLQPSPAINGHSGSAHSSSPRTKSPPNRPSTSADVSEGLVESPPKKKRKISLDADALFAAKLQAEENMLARPTRGGNSRKVTPVKKKKSPKKKTPAKVRGSDDSDVEDSEAGEPKPPKNTGFHKPMNLSPPLSELFGGVTSLSRPQCVKKLWEYVRTNDLQDPADRRNILCDDPMRAVFKQDKVHMFQMTKILYQNLYNPDE